MSGYAWVTLATNNAYSLGALVLAHSLKKEKTIHKLVVLITPAVSQPMREQLQTVFDVVKVVDVLDSKDEAHLALMKRPDLGITFTKIHCWRLVEFEKCVFLDADTLVVRNCDELFEREEFSAAPDVSWPDCFNSGVFVYRPSIETFNKLLQFAVENRSFDGGDQGLLNQYFSDWATEDIKKHLPFIYNLTSVAAYSYIPAFKHYGAETRIVHFIGTGKPWLQQLDITTKTVTPISGSEHLAPLFQKWWDLFCEKVHPNLDKNLESSNDGMSHSLVEACSNSLPNALVDESQTLHLIEPCTPYREKDDFRQYNLPYQPFDVKGSSGELLNVEFLLASVVPPTAPGASLDEQQRLETNKMEEKDKVSRREEGNKMKDEKLESNTHLFQENIICQESKATQEPEKIEENKKNEDEEQNLQQLEEQQKQEEPASPKDPFDYNSFFPDETCINDYLERNVEIYQPFENQHHCDLESSKETNNSNSEQDHQQNIPSLPRFLTIPEDDRRQSGNIKSHLPEEHHEPERKPPQEDSLNQQQDRLQENLIGEKEPLREFQAESFIEKRELTKSKSMPYLPHDITTNELPLPPTKSIWKSQPDINVDLNRKYSMPKLKPILPKQNSFSKSLSSVIPKVTLYTEFLMSSEYKDPDNLPKDKVGFVETHIHKEAKLRRIKSDVDIPSKFGPLPYAISPEVEKPVIPKKIPFRHLENELYDLTQCKRQMGNKPKSKDSDKRKENIRSLPPLKPLVPTKDKKPTVVKKRKSKELSPGDRGREKIPRRESKLERERERATKSTSRNISMNANSNDLDEILNRLRDFSKDYQHFFGTVPYTSKGTVKCKSISMQASDQNEVESKTSEIFETGSSPTTARSEETQISKNENYGAAFENSKFRQFKKYIEGQKKASQKGLINIQDILSESSTDEKEVIRSSVLEERRDNLVQNTSGTKTKDENTKLVEENIQAQNIHSKKEYSAYQSHPNTESLNVADSSQKVMMIRSKTEGVACSKANKLETNSATDKTVQSHSKFDICSENFRHIGAKPDKIIPLRFKEQKQKLTDGKKKPDRFEGSKTFFGLKSAENRVVIKDKREILVHSKEDQDNENLDITKTRDNFKESNCSLISELGQKDAPSVASSRQNSELNNCLVGKNSSVKSSEKVAEFIAVSKNSSSSTLAQKKKTTSDEIKLREKPMNCRDKKCDDSRKNLGVADVTKNLVPVISSFKTLQNEPSGLIMFSDDEKTKENFIKCKTTPNVLKHQEDAVVRAPSAPLNATEKLNTKEPKKPEDVLCIPEFDTPRSSRVTTPMTEATASVLVEHIVKKATDESLQKPRTSIAPKSPHSTLRKFRESRTIPKNVPVNGLENGQVSENRSTIFSNNSPEGTIRLESKITPDKNSGKKPPSTPLHSTPESGKAQPENLEDLKSKSGIAGAIAQLSLEAGSGQTSESVAISAAHQEYIRRQNWETGNIDYMGKDSFDNIWSKICQTIEAKESEEAVGGKTENLKITTEEEKLKKASPEECPVSLSSILKNCSEYIEILPGEPATGPVEDDEIIFSKPENKQSCLTNIIEEEEVGTEGSGRNVTRSVKISDILLPEASADGMKNTETEISYKSEKSQNTIRTEKIECSVGKEKEPAIKAPPGGENKNSLGMSTEVKPLPVIPSTEDTKKGLEATSAEIKPFPVSSSAEETKKGLEATSAEIKPLPVGPSAEETKKGLEATSAEIKPLPVSSSAEETKKGLETTPAEIKPLPVSSSAEETKKGLETTPAEIKPLPVGPSAEETKKGLEATPAEIKPLPVSSSAEETKKGLEATPAEIKPLPVGLSAEEIKKGLEATSAEIKPLPVSSSAEEAKPQSVFEKPECKTVAICQPSVPRLQSSPSDAPKQPETAAKHQKSEAELKEKTQQCSTVAIMMPSNVLPNAGSKKDKKLAKDWKTEEKPEAKLEPIPLPAPDSPTFAPPQELAPKVSNFDVSNHEGKQKKGVFTKLLEMVGVAPKEKNGNEISKSVFYDVEGGIPSKPQIENMEKQVLAENEEPSESLLSAPMVESRLSIDGNYQVKEAEQEKAADCQKLNECSSSTPKKEKSEFIPPVETAQKPLDAKDANETHEIKFPGAKQSEKNEEKTLQTKENQKSASTEDKGKNKGNKQKSGQPSKPARNSSTKELKQPDDSTQMSATKRKSTGPKVTTISQRPPETETTALEPHPATPPGRNSALLTTNDPILKTPPVPESLMESVDETVKGKVTSEIENIISKAKSEVESLLQDRRSLEKELGDSTDLITAMKLMMGEELSEKTTGEELSEKAAAEDVEELRVTTEEERKRPKSSKNSKLSDQILKAIPPPRRKAISEASASTGIPKETATPEQKSSSGESKPKASKPSSIPVPPPRSRGKPTQPAPSKGKGKK